MRLSNKTLSFLVILAMSLSLVSTLSLLNRIQSVLPSAEELTGRAQFAQGEVNLTVETAISIILWNNTIDFGKGHVNTSGPKVAVCANYANLSIRWDGGALTYNDTSDNDCWNSVDVGQPTTPTHPFTIENEGNQNVTLSVLGPTPVDFFNNEPTSPEYYNLSWQGENMEANACSVAGDFETDWTTFSGVTQTICANERYGFVSGADDLAVNIAVQIPTTGLTAGTEYKNSSITFTAT